MQYDSQVAICRNYLIYIIFKNNIKFKITSKEKKMLEFQG